MTKIDTIMDNLYINEIAADLEVAQEEVLMNNITTFNGDECCRPVEFCCLVTVPEDFVLTNDLAYVTFDPDCLKLKLKEIIKGEEIQGCPIDVAKYKITGCVSVHASANVYKILPTAPTDPVLFRVCCCNCLCIKACVICCNPHINVDNLDNIKIEANLTNPPVLVGSDCGNSVYKLSGLINISLVNCN